MRLPRSKLGLAVLFFLVFVVGCFVGLMTSSYLYYRHVFSKAVDENAVDLKREITILSQLRLGEIDAVIDDLEMRVDGNIRSVALTPNIPRTDYRYKVLKAAKTYRDIYSSKSERASQVTGVLKDIPKIETFECETPLCRLVKHAKEKEVE
ncbi:MAG: hypothetical protein U9Q07_09640 [Planctomycetota bacterium]|nr:hypothetical protein [Planctomycetota bacterium]